MTDTSAPRGDDRDTVELLTVIAQCLTRDETRKLQERDESEARSRLVLAGQREIKDMLEGIKAHLEQVATSSATTAIHTRHLASVRRHTHEIAISSAKIQAQTKPKRPPVHIHIATAIAIYLVSTFTGVMIEVMGDYSKIKAPLEAFIDSLVATPSAMLQWLFSDFGAVVSIVFGGILGLHVARLYARHREQLERHDWLAKRATSREPESEERPVYFPPPAGFDSGQGVEKIFDAQYYEWPSSRTTEVSATSSAYEEISEALLKYLVKKNRRDLAIKLKL